MVNIIIQLISGAIGGNGAGALMKKLSLGTIGNSIVGILGGGLGGQLMGLLGIGTAAAGGLDLNSIISSVVSGGVGGGALMAIIGAVKKAIGK
jgi:uncharacterized membrane protein YeaQ/YmgE (transglycosylase-associated protein family)